MLSPNTVSLFLTNYRCAISDKFPSRIAVREEQPHRRAGWGLQSWWGSIGSRPLRNGQAVSRVPGESILREP